MTIFEFVHVSSHIIFRKITASFVLALFIFINAEKVFHKHQQDANTAQKAIALKPVTANCAICDFQLTKNAEIPVLISTNITSIAALKEYATSPVFYHYLPATQITNRGPPVIGLLF